MRRSFLGISWWMWTAGLGGLPLSFAAGCGGGNAFDDEGGLGDSGMSGNDAMSHQDSSGETSADAGSESSTDTGTDSHAKDVAPGDVKPGDVGPGDVGPGDVGPGDVGPGDVTVDAPGDARDDIVYFPDTGPDVIFFDGGYDVVTTCAPGSIAGFTPTVETPTPVCTTAQVSAIVSACFIADLDGGADASAAACEAIITSPSYSTCFDDCIYTTTTATPWGALVQLENPGPTTYFDTGECVSALDPSTTGQACASDLEAELQCLLFACSTSCPVPADTDPGYAAAENALDACFSLAASTTGVCASYVTAIDGDCASEAVDGGLGDPCFVAENVIDTTTSTPAQLTSAWNQYLDAVCVPGPDL